MKAQRTGGGGKGGGSGSEGLPDKKGKGKGKPAGRNANTREPPTLPQELANLGMEWRGRCWDYNNKKGCSKAKAGGSCEKGAHVCMHPGCGGPHPAVNHH